MCSWPLISRPYNLMQSYISLSLSLSLSISLYLVQLYVYYTPVFASFLLCTLRIREPDTTLYMGRVWVLKLTHIIMIVSILSTGLASFCFPPLFPTGQDCYRFQKLGIYRLVLAEICVTWSNFFCVNIQGLQSLFFCSVLHQERDYQRLNFLEQVKGDNGKGQGIQIRSNCQEKFCCRNPNQLITSMYWKQNEFVLVL